VNGLVYVGSYDGSVYGFSLKHGREEAAAPSRRLELKMLRLDLNLKMPQPGATSSGAQL